MLVFLVFFTTGTSAGTVDVQVGGDAPMFFPETVTVNPGDTVRWTWANPTMGASVTSGTPSQPTGLFDSGIHKAPSTFSYTFQSVGQFDYFCRAENEMKGSVTVSAAQTVTVHVSPTNASHQFVPQFVSIAPGDTVHWVWDESNHTVTSGDPATGVASNLFGTPLSDTGYEYSFTFPNAGTFDYYCAPHRTMGMTGRITVGGPASASQPLNISTRLRVQSGENVLIGGFILTGNAAKKLIVRAIGPSLGQAGLSDVLADPIVELKASDGSPITSNDNWKSFQQTEIQASGVAPQNDLESAIVATLTPGGYTAIVSGKNATTGVGLVEVYDLDQPADSKLANISTRGLVQTGSSVMIGGFILGNGSDNANVIVRAIGPSLSQSGITGALADPTLELHDGNGALRTSNDNWQDSQKAEIEATGIPPQNDFESAIVATLPPGSYTAIVAGKGDTIGVALVEVYRLP
jgi:plastocyanin